MGRAMKSNAHYLTEKQITQFAADFADFFANPDDNSAGSFRWDIVVRVQHCVYPGDDLGDSIKVVAIIRPRNFNSGSPIRLYLSTVRDVMAGATLARDFRTLDAAFNAACGLVDRLREVAQDQTNMLLSVPYAGHVEYDRSIF